MSCGVGRRCSSDPVLLWLRHRLAGTAPIRPLAWEPPYAMGVALEKTTTTKKSKNKKENTHSNHHDSDIKSKDTDKKENYWPISLMNIDSKSPQQTLANKKDQTPSSS